MTNAPDCSATALSESLAAIRETKPLVQQLTNEVTKHDLANITLHWGALPVMADAPDEAPEMAELAGAILLNTGRMSDSNIEALHNAGEAANELGVPVVLDPVGVGATSTRTAVAESLLETVDCTAIKGNYGEISALAGVEADVKGVESVGEYDEIAQTAQALADATGAAVVASGEQDVVASADVAYHIESGHEMMGEVVGTGCMLGSTVATFCTSVDEPLTAAVHATLAYGLVGERAAEIDYNGPASYRTNFHDSVWNFTPEAAAALTEDLTTRLVRAV